MTTSSTFTSIASVVAASFGPVLTADALWNGTSQADKAGKTFLWTSPQGNLAVSSFDANGNWIPTVVNGQGFSDTLVRGGASDKSLMAEITTAKTVVVAPTPEVTTQESMDGGETDAPAGFDLVDGVAVSQEKTYTATEQLFLSKVDALTSAQLNAVLNVLDGTSSLPGMTQAQQDAHVVTMLKSMANLDTVGYKGAEALHTVGIFNELNSAQINNVFKGGIAHITDGVVGKAHDTASITKELLSMDAAAKVTLASALSAVNDDFSGNVSFAQLATQPGYTVHDAANSVIEQLIVVLSGDHVTNYDNVMRADAVQVLNTQSSYDFFQSNIKLVGVTAADLEVIAGGDVAYFG